MVTSRPLKPDILRVGVFTNAYRPSVSGVVNCIDLVRRELLRQGHRTLVFAPRGDSSCRPAGIVSFPSLNLTRKAQFPIPLPFSCRAWSWLRRVELSVVHAHHPGLLGDVAYAYSRWRGVPLVFTFHTQYEQYAHYISLPQPAMRALARFAVSQFARRCHLIIAPSPIIADYIHDLRLPNRIVTLPNAIDLSQFERPPHPDARQGVRERFGIPPQARVALYAGRIAQEKNLFLLLRAFARAAQEQPDGHLMIVGDGHLVPELQALASELELSQRVHLVGRVAYSDMPDFYHASDFFAMASVTEVKPLVVLEALAAGLPVVAVAACGTADTVSHDQDGWLCRESEDELAGWIARAFRDDASRQRLAARARVSARAYGIENYTLQLVALYREAQERMRPSTFTRT